MSNTESCQVWGGEQHLSQVLQGDVCRSWTGWAQHFHERYFIFWRLCNICRFVRRAVALRGSAKKITPVFPSIRVDLTPMHLRLKKCQPESLNSYMQKCNTMDFVTFWSWEYQFTILPTQEGLNYGTCVMANVFLLGRIALGLVWRTGEGWRTRLKWSPMNMNPSNSCCPMMSIPNDTSNKNWL